MERGDEKRRNDHLMTCGVLWFDFLDSKNLGCEGIWFGASGGDDGENRYNR